MATELETERENIDDRSSKKIKLQPTEDTELQEKIAKQVEYYFSDVNIVRDKFLLGEVKKDEGWVNLSVLLTFSRLKEMTKDEEKLLEALKEITSQIIELDGTKKRVRRKEPLPDIAEYQKQLDLRTVHVSGFPTDYKFEALRRFCAQYGEVESVNMRLHFKTRFFKGCIHVVFKNVDDAKKLLAEEVLKCKDRELRSESMEQYHKRKAEMAQKRLENRKRKGKSD